MALHIEDKMLIELNRNKGEAPEDTAMRLVRAEEGDAVIGARQGRVQSVSGEWFDAVIVECTCPERGENPEIIYKEAA